MYNWNPVFNLIMEIKEEYYNQFGDFGDYIFEEWLQKLNKQKYNDIFECLQVNQFNEFILIGYGLAEMQEGMWTDTSSIYRECRSIVIDINNDELVLTPFRKFFNLNEVEENKLESLTNKISNANTVEVANKLDGSMQNARWYSGKVFMAGSMVLDKNESWRLQEGCQMLTQNYITMLQQNPKFTFIFEYISLKDAHVVLYKKENEGLHLIGVRDTTTGKQFSYSEVLEMANKYKVSCVALENKNIQQLLEETKTVQSHEKEGWVLNIDGHLVKIKCDDYVNIHRLLDKVSSANVIIEAIADDKYDDLVSKIPDKYKDRVGKIAKLIFDYSRNTNKNIKNYYDLAPKDSRKNFMIWADNEVPKEIRSYVRNEYLGKEYNLLKRGKTGYKRMSDLGYDEKYPVLFASVVGGENNE